MPELSIGILGAGRIAENAIVVPARHVPVRLAAVAARDRQRAADYAARFDIGRVHDSYADLVADPGIDAIYNPLPNSLHTPWNLAAIENGKHVLSEKPFAVDAEEAALVRDAAVKAGVVIVEGFHYMYHPVMQRLLELLFDGALGELLSAEAVMTVPEPPAEDTRWSLPLAGGALMDLGGYCLHAHRLLASVAGGEPTIADASGNERQGVPGIDESCQARLTFPSGAVGRIVCHMASREVRMTFRVVGTRGHATAQNFVLPHLDNRLTITDKRGERVERLGEHSSYTYQLGAFVRSVQERQPIPTDAEDAVATMKLIDDCYQLLGLTAARRASRC